MMPMIRIDDEVYEFLNSQGKTEDTFNSVLRRLLGLEARKKRAGHFQETQQRVPQTPLRSPENMAPLLPLIEKHLPPRLENPVHRRQVEKVVSCFLQTPPDWRTRDREIWAAKKVAEEEGVTRETIQDGGTRRLGLNIHEFRQRLEAIEADWRQDPSRSRRGPIIG